MSMSFNNVNTRLGATLSAAAISLGGLAGCGERVAFVPANEAQAAECLARAERLGSVVQAKKDAGTPGNWTKAVNGMTGVKEQPGSVNDAAGATLGEYHRCLNEKGMQNGIDAEAAIAKQPAVPSSATPRAESNLGGWVSRSGGEPLVKPVPSIENAINNAFDVKLKFDMGAGKKPAPCATDRLKQERIESSGCNVTR